MNTLQKLSMAVLLLSGAGAAQAIPIVWTDTTGLNPSVYSTDWAYQADIQNGVIQIAGNSGLTELFQDQGLIGLIDTLSDGLREEDGRKCHRWNKRCHHRTVPEPGALSLLALGFAGVAIALRSGRKLRARLGNRMGGAA